MYNFPYEERAREREREREEIKRRDKIFFYSAGTFVFREIICSRYNALQVILD